MDQRDEMNAGLKTRPRLATDSRPHYQNLRGEVLASICETQIPPASFFLAHRNLFFTISAVALVTTSRMTRFTAAKSRNTSPYCRHFD